MGDPALSAILTRMRKTLTAAMIVGLAISMTACVGEPEPVTAQMEVTGSLSGEGFHILPEATLTS